MPGSSARRSLGLSLTLICLVPCLSPALAFPRGGGGFGGGGMRFGGGGGMGFDSGRYHFGGAGYDGRGTADDWRRGYQGYHPHYGPDSRPAWQEGGRWRDDQWNGDRVNEIDRNRLNVNRSGDFDNNTFRRTVNVNNNFYNRNVNGWNANWARGGYWNNRPWNAGWYGWTPSTWGWWGASSAGWGLAAGLAAGAAITELVNSAADNQKTVIVVPGSTYQLNYGSVESVGLYGASFSYNLGDGVNLNGAANCQAGLLNGQVPATAPQAQLLNAVCQVAYGTGG
ncbi:MAG: hypothetical protein VKK03_09710 [Synechococcus sp.]|nr:hypothetical protein [Synechococcus sp.]